MVLVRCHNKSYNVSVAPMADVDAVVGMVARLALPARSYPHFPHALPLCGPPVLASATGASGAAIVAGGE